MTRQPSPPPHDPRRLVTTIAAAVSLTLGALAAACFDVGSYDEGYEPAALPPVDCTGLAEWAQNTTYAPGVRVIDTGDAFFAVVGHTAFGVDWNPKRAASLWRAVGPCIAGTAGGGAAPPAPEPPAPEPPAPEPPAPAPEPPAPPPPPAGGDTQCQANGRPGPLFDPAGAKNVGNGAGQQFIGGQCLSSADCASACCALPCGICSGPGAQFQNGKQGCGFGD